MFGLRLGPGAPAGLFMVGMDEIGVARRRPVEVDDKTLGEAFVHTGLRADIVADIDGEVTGHHRLERADIRPDALLLGLRDVGPEADEDAMSDHGPT